MVGFAISTAGSALAVGEHLLTAASELFSCRQSNPERRVHNVTGSSGESPANRFRRGTIDVNGVVVAIPGPSGQVTDHPGTRSREAAASGPWEDGGGGPSGSPSVFPLSGAAPGAPIVDPSRSLRSRFGILRPSKGIPIGRWWPA